MSAVPEQGLVPRQDPGTTGPTRTGLRRGWSVWEWSRGDAARLRRSPLNQHPQCTLNTLSPISFWKQTGLCPNAKTAAEEALPLEEKNTNHHLSQVEAELDVFWKQA